MTLRIFSPARWLMALLCLLVVPSASAARADTPPVAAAQEEQQPGDWPSYGRTPSEQRYSPLSQIDRRTVGQLKLAWYLDLDSNRGQEGTPLVVNGVMYATTNWSRVKALDAATGRVLWEYDPRTPGDIALRGCCDTVNRGAAYWEGKVYVGTFDGRLIALDARNGRPVWSVNTIPADATLGDIRSYTVDGAPRIAHGVVVIGNGGAEFGARGFVSGFDARTGALKWRFYTVPAPGNRPDHAASDATLSRIAWPTWQPDGGWTRSGGGGTVWDSIVYDPVTDLLYIGVGNGSPWNYRFRSNGVGDNLFLGSIVALRPQTGEYVWHFQETPKDQWDFTASQHIMTLDLPIDGQVRHVIVHAPKNGFFYVLDARSGEFLSGTSYVFQNWADGLDPVTGRPRIRPEAMWSLTDRPWVGIPGALGAHNWQPMAYSPRTGLVYIPAQQIPALYKTPDRVRLHPVGLNLGAEMAAGSAPDDPAARAQAAKALQGWLLAWDPVAQKARFRVDHRGPWNGGLLATGGDLVFQGLANGEFHAYDATNGQDLFRFNAQSGVIAPPVTYMAGGRQFVAVEVGWGGIYPLLVGGMARTGGWTVNHSRILAFALDGDATLPPSGQKGFLPVAPPVDYDAQQAGAGYVHYQNFCIACHGDNAESGGVLPDLRWSGAIRTPEGFRNVVLHGALTAYGMGSFASVLDDGQAEQIRQFLIKRANDTYAHEMHIRDNPAGVPEGIDKD